MDQSFDGKDALNGCQDMEEGAKLVGVLAHEGDGNGGRPDSRVKLGLDHRDLGFHAA